MYTDTHKCKQAHFILGGCLLLPKRCAIVKTLSSAIQLHHFRHDLINQPYGLILQELRIKGLCSYCQNIGLANVGEEDKDLYQG